MSGRLSYNEILVLQALSAGCQYGFEVMELTGLSGGTVYPILRRLEVGQQVQSRKEDEQDARAEGRPARRLHTLTPSGRAALVTAREQLLVRQRALGLIDS